MLGLGSSLIGSTKPFQPNDISSLIANFSASYGIEKGGSGNAFVTKWKDITGSGFYLQSPSANSRPTVPTVSASNGAIEGNPQITFDNTSVADVLNLFDSGNDPASITLDTNQGGWSIFIVYTSDNWDDGKIVIGNGANANDHILHASGANTIQLKAGGTAKDFTLAGGLTDNRYNCVGFTADQNGLTRMYIDNVLASDTETNTADFTISQVGAGNDTGNMKGSIKEIIIYDKELTTQERNSVYSYLLYYKGTTQ